MARKSIERNILILAQGKLNLRRVRGFACSVGSDILIRQDPHEFTPAPQEVSDSFILLDSSLNSENRSEIWKKLCQKPFKGIVSGELNALLSLNMFRGILFHFFKENPISELKNIFSWGFFNREFRLDSKSQFARQIANLANVLNVQFFLEKSAIHFCQSFLINTMIQSSDELINWHAISYMNDGLNQGVILRGKLNSTGLEDHSWSKFVEKLHEVKGSVIVNISPNKDIELGYFHASYNEENEVLLKPCQMVLIMGLDHLAKGAAIPKRLENAG